MVRTKHSRTSAQVSAGFFLYFFPTERWVCSTSYLAYFYPLNEVQLHVLILLPGNLLNLIDLIGRNFIEGLLSFRMRETDFKLRTSPDNLFPCSTSNVFAARTECNTLCSGPEAGVRIGDDCSHLDLCWHELLLSDISVVAVQKLPISHQVTHASVEESISICCLGSVVTSRRSGLSLTGTCCIFRNICSEIFFLLPFFP